MVLIYLAIFLQLVEAFGQVQWHHSTLTFHYNDRTQDQWKRHLMRVNKNNEFTGKWTFDAHILAYDELNGQSLTYDDNFSGENMKTVLNGIFQDATELDKAAISLSSIYGNPTKQIYATFAMPYVSKYNQNLVLDRSYNTTIKTERINAGKWYLNEIKKRSENAKWTHLKLYGYYFFREELPERHEDSIFAMALNLESHKMGMKNVWIPFYDADEGWNGKANGFDAVVMQPRYSFLSTIDYGIVRPQRLYQTANKALQLGIGMEFELRGYGYDELSNQISHQYLAVAQKTGVSKLPNAYFLGGPKDFLDDLNCPKSDKCGGVYEDLMNYVQEIKIKSYEINIPWNPIAIDETNLKYIFILSKPVKYGEEGTLNSIRMDFMDKTNWNPFKGRLNVLINGNPEFGSYGIRVGLDELMSNYHSISVPLPFIEKGTVINSYTIQLVREKYSDWPNVIRMVGGVYEPLFIANPILNKFSSASNTLPVTGPYTDSRDTFANYDYGKLTDGRESQEFWSESTMGWKQIEQKFTITIDLLTIRSISSIKIKTWKEYGAALFEPLNIGAYFGEDCAPQEIGTLNSACVPSGSAGRSEFIPKGGNEILIVMHVNNINARFVTVTGVCHGWCLFDEFKVYDSSEQWVSYSKPYKLNPKPTEKKVMYEDEGMKLTDGAIFKDWIFGPSCVGINLESEQRWVEATWDEPKEAKSAVIWMTNPRKEFGIFLPPKVEISVRNEYKQWQSGIIVDTNSNSAKTPIARLNFLGGNLLITGIRGTFPQTKGWVFVSEISTIN